ncbi:anthranilate phosphoribosyltransferase family protein [Anabaena sp. FACHB-1237]|uniref:anthranilate phosphoribosyltransferase family protein n=1 Tax=Anabaena sp. FACHB-1237 TaxID=2692769 RepID=UPI00168137B3|nr:anthranilate phosphoribosyltransferase family protein [Anabaena sp. FACHB-1237]MBD2139781.1 anthranilate phosphoribosyltransferase family protein [Anabaena sp. FACHB-1237]
MNKIFRELIQKVGSGTHTSKNLTRAEAYTAMKMMLLGQATPVQIGAFLIAHRMKRPTGEELAGMLDAYQELGPKLTPINNKTVIVLGMPYDGRTRTAPINIITALLLASTGQPVIMHGGDRYPTKYGLPLIEIWHNLGVNWRNLSLAQTQEIFAKTNLGFIYTPDHFSITKTLWQYREQLGKRPPLATMELIWCPYTGDSHIMAGFVHPPTENIFKDALDLHNVQKYTFIKGLEGSCDLPCDRTAIISFSSAINQQLPKELQRLFLSSTNYGFTNQNVPLITTEELIKNLKKVLKGESCELMETAIWNGGFYLWHSGICSNIHSGIEQARELLISGKVAAQLEKMLQF